MGNCDSLSKKVNVEQIKKEVNTYNVCVSFKFLHFADNGVAGGDVQS